MKISELNSEYDKLQLQYGAKELTSIYNGGCTNNPDFCFIFMNPTGKNIASDPSWKGRRSPWIGTKNIWKLFYKIGLLDEEIYMSIMSKKPQEWNEEFARGEGEAEKVRLPHTVKELPLHQIDEKSYQMLSGYRKRFFLPADEKGKRCFLQFDAAAHIATIFVNGCELKTHRCGYTAFRVEFTEVAVWGAENLVAVRLDSTENPSVPPFGFVIDYLTYGGLYRPAYMESTYRMCTHNIGPKNAWCC